MPNQPNPNYHKVAVREMDLEKWDSNVVLCLHLTDWDWLKLWWKNSNITEIYSNNDFLAYTPWGGRRNLRVFSVIFEILWVIIFVSPYRDRGVRNERWDGKCSIVPSNRYCTHCHISISLIASAPWPPDSRFKFLGIFWIALYCTVARTHTVSLLPKEVAEVEILL